MRRQKLIITNNAPAVLGFALALFLDKQGQKA